MPRPQGKRVLTIGVLVSQETKDFLQELASEDSRSVSWVAHELLQRGVAAYRRDGLVREPEASAAKGGRARKDGTSR